MFYILTRRFASFEMIKNFFSQNENQVTPTPRDKIAYQPQL